MTGKLNKVFGKTPEKKEVSGVFSWNGCKNFGFAFLLVMILIGCTGHFVFAEDMREAGSAPNVSVVYEDQYEIPEGFEFSVQIQKDKNGTIITEFVPFGSWDNKEKRLAELDEDAVITRITDESKKGLIGGWYYNVGIYDGKIVDLKCTIEDYQQTTNEISGKASLGWIALSAEHLGIYQNYMEWVELRMEFFDSRTGEPLEVTGTAVITDIDRYEGMAILSEYEHILLAEDCRLEQTALEENYILFKETEGKCAADENEDDWAQVQVEFTSDIFCYRSYSSPEDTGEYKWIDPVAYSSWFSYSSDEAVAFVLDFQGYSDCRLVPLLPGNVSLAVSDGDEDHAAACLLKNREESFSYEICCEIPKEHEKWYYDGFTVKAELLDILEFCSGSAYAPDGENITDQFYLREKDGVVTFVAKQQKNPEFYGKTFRFYVDVKIKEDVDLSSFWNGRYYVMNQKTQIEIQQKAKQILQETKEVCVYIDSEYTDGEIFLKLTDALSGVSLANGEFILSEWNEREGRYCETQNISYARELSGYYFKGLEKTHKNQGRYKIVASKIPEHYTGKWEQEILVDKNDTRFSFEVKYQPSGENRICMIASILKEDGTVTEEIGTQEAAVPIERGDRIRYHIYVERDCAPSFKSGEITVTNQIPEGALYKKESLNLIGEIRNQVETSTARIASVRLDKDGVLTWKIHNLDDGEIAHVIFEVDVPQSEVIFSNYAEMMEDTEDMQVISSNVLIHELRLPIQEDSLSDFLDDSSILEENNESTKDIIPPAEINKDSEKEEVQTADTNTGNIIENAGETEKNTEAAGIVQTGDSAKGTVFCILIGISTVIVLGCMIRLKRTGRGNSR